jgi:hypothetical protein
MRLARSKPELDVRGVAAGADAERDVAGRSERFDLALEDPVVAVVVADRGQNRRVGGERDGRPAASLAHVAADELGGQVLSVGGAATVAEQSSL